MVNHATTVEPNACDDASMNDSRLLQYKNQLIPTPKVGRYQKRKVRLAGTNERQEITNSVANITMRSLLNRTDAKAATTKEH